MKNNPNAKKTDMESAANLIPEVVGNWNEVS
jgi:hypothetical protein